MSKAGAQDSGFQSDFEHDAGGISDSSRRDAIQTYVLGAVLTGAAGAAAIAGSVLFGWVADVSALRSVLPGAVEMKFNTALGLLACAALLWIASAPSWRASPGANLAARGIAVCVAVLGLSTLSQYAFGWNLGIDEAFITDRGASFNVAKGRMSPYTATGFVAMGLSLLGILSPWPIVIARASAVLALWIGAFSLVGYAWNASVITTDAFLPPVAVNTAAALALLAVGALAASFRADEFAASRATPFKSISSVEWKVLLGFGGALLLLVVGGSFSYQASKSFASSAQWVSHTQQVRGALSELRADVAGIGLAQRNYLITGKPEFLELHRASVTEVQGSISRLRALVVDNPRQVGNLKELESLVGAMEGVLAETIALYGSGGFARVQAVVAQGAGTDAIAGVMRLLDRMVDVEDQLLRSREAASAVLERYVLSSSLATITAAALVFALLFRNIRDQMRARQFTDDRLRQARKAAEDARRDADAANRAKTRFLAAMSHEIRTPMNGVMGLLELMSLGKLEPDQRSTLGVVRQSGRSLLRIVDDILDFSKIEAGKMELHSQPASLSHLVNHVCRVNSGAASSKGLLLEARIDPRIAAAHSFDPLRMEQVLNNLVSNAVKFTERGSVEVSVELRAHSEGREELRIAVRDSGIGIAPDKVSQLFQPYTQAEAETSSRYGGTGLGLAICKRIADLMGGVTELTSILGVGTTATLHVTLPIANRADVGSTAPGGGEASNVVENRREAPSVADARAEGTLVLVVDDHPTNRLVLKRQLNLLGYAVETAADGALAFEAFCNRRFGAVITDCNMPEMSGYELARKIRAFENSGHRTRVPILACTANALPSEAAICTEAGMDDYVVKPAQLEALARRLDHWLPLPSAAATPADAAAPGTSAGMSLLNQTLLDAITGGQRLEEVAVLEDFIRLSLVDADGLRQALQAGTALDVTHFAHRIHGSCNMLGADGLAAASVLIEAAARIGDLETARSHIDAFEHELRQLGAYIEARCRTLRNAGASPVHVPSVH